MLSLLWVWLNSLIKGHYVMIGQSAPQSLALGQLGVDYIDSTHASSYNSWGRIYCLADCTFTTLTGENYTNAAQITLAAGMEIQGYFTVIVVASGKVLAYRA